MAISSSPKLAIASLQYHSLRTLNSSRSLLPTFNSHAIHFFPKFRRLSIQCTTKQAPLEIQGNNVGVELYNPKSYELLTANSLAYTCLEIDFPPMPSEISPYKPLLETHIQMPEVHPRADTPTLATGEPQKLMQSSDPPTLPPPPQGTYVIQLPQDPIFKYPPPENTHCSKKKTRRSRCRRCFCWTPALVTFLAAVSASILYLVYRPKAPTYTIDNLSIQGINLTATRPISPQIAVTVRAINPNDKVGIYYETGSSSELFYSGVNLCKGVLPAFYQATNNLTVFQTKMRGSDIVLSSQLHSALLTGQKQRRVSLRLNLEVPVKFKVGSVKIWTITFKIKCELTVNELTADSNIVSYDCDPSLKMW